MLLPSLVSLLVPLAILTRNYKSAAVAQYSAEHLGPSRPYVTPVTRRERRIMLAIGLGGMLFVPIFKTLTHLPPYMGMMLVLGLIWVASEVLHSDKDEADRKKFTASYALSRIDTPSILFFLGILLAVGSLEATGILRLLAGSLSQAVGNLDVIIVLIGIVSAVVDNVPIVAATMGMYDLQTYPVDSKIWTFHGLLCRYGRESAAHWFGSGGGRDGHGKDGIWLVFAQNKLAGLGWLRGRSGGSIWPSLHPVSVS